MKKLLVLSLSLLMLSACGGKDTAKNEKTDSSDNAKYELTEELKEKKSKHKEYLKLGDTWEIPDQWKLTVNSVTVTDKKPKDYESKAEQSVIVKYTYENLGYETAEGYGLSINHPNSVVDQSGRVARYYYISGLQGPDKIGIGESHEAEVAYDLTKKSENVQVTFMASGDNVKNKESYSVTFDCPVTE